MLRASKKDIQPAWPLCLIDRSESLKEITILIATVCHRNEDYVTLVALNILQVLDEERFRCLLLTLNEKLRDFVITYPFRQKFVEKLTLLIVNATTPSESSGDACI